MLDLLAKLLKVFIIITVTVSSELKESPEECKIVAVRDYLKMKCRFQNGTEYYKCTNSEIYYDVTIEECDFQEHTAICDKDPGFYQVCGHVTCAQKQYQKQGNMLCGSFMCNYWLEHTWYRGDKGALLQKHDPKYVNQGGNEMPYFFQCDGAKSCKNTDVDEEFCSEDKFVCNKRENSFEEYINSTEVCDEVCRCYLCQDEVDCNDTNSEILHCNNTFHMRIGFNTWETPLIPPAVICDGVLDCRDGSDEANCYGTETCISNEKLGSKNLTLTENNRCTVPNKLYLVCQDYKDQLNCSHVLDSPLLCRVNGHVTSVSRYALCKETSLCDNELDKDCDAAEGGCIVHKHRFCDGVTDCPEGKDEDNVLCKYLTSQTCKRKLSNSNFTREELRIPVAWVKDGVEDCLDGKDEDADSWKMCGEGWHQRYVDTDVTCSDVFLCSNVSQKFEYNDKLCDRAGPCSKEHDICEVSRNLPRIQSEVIVSKEGHIVIGYHLQGLEIFEKEHNLKKYHDVDFNSPDGPFGVAPQPIIIALSSGNKSDCSFVFGELYVYLSCSEFCNKASCPLRPVKHDSCHNIKDHRVFTLSNKNYLTIASERKGKFVSNLFPCKNGYCVTYDKVCDLVDDCEDGSDETDCINHFTCKQSGEMIPLTNFEDGQYDCGDFSDECSNSKNIIEETVLSVTAWLVGIPATLFNIIVLKRSAGRLSGVDCPFILLNRTMILMVAIGDLMVGLYLIVLSVVNVLLKDSYCTERYTWLTSSYCSAMGVVNSTGAQISLFSMVVLSVSRVINIKRLGRASRNGRGVTLLVTLTSVTIVLAVSFAISYIPLLDSLEDFFVNGLYYDKSIKLFIGAPSKQKHIAILEKYYSKFRGNPDLPWSTVRRLVRNMFSQNYGGVSGVKLHFYGNAGVCLFKYFVTAEDPQAFYAFNVLLLNLICFIIIASSYIIICLYSLSSSRQLKKMSNTGASTRSPLHRKLALIILTDFFCWVPFIIVATLHYYRVLDASPWYGTFSILILPINSVINPILYDPYLEAMLGKIAQQTTRRLQRRVAVTRRELVSTNPPASVITEITLTSPNRLSTKSNENFQGSNQINGSMAGASMITSAQTRLSPKPTTSLCATPSLHPSPSEIQRFPVSPSQLSRAERHALRMKRRRERAGARFSTTAQSIRLFSRISLANLTESAVGLMEREEKGEEIDEEEKRENTNEEEKLKEEETEL